MAVASLYGFCAIFSLKEAHDIAREVDSSNPAYPASFAPFLEVRLCLPDVDLMLTLPGTIHKNGWNRPENGFPGTTFAREASCYAASTSGAEERDVHSSIFLGHSPWARECETKSMQRPEITARRQSPIDAHPVYAMDLFHHRHRE